MSLVEQLGVEYRNPSPLQRGAQRIGSTRIGAWVFQRTLFRVDRLLLRLTDGRVTAPGLLAGLPVVQLTTTGRRSGLRRTSPLLGIPVGGQLAVIGSNFGQAPTPGWVHNLEADPHATLSHRGVAIPVVARPATPAEAETAFDRGAQLFPGYATYRQRAGHRTIRVFVLGPASTRPPEA